MCLTQRVLGRPAHGPQGSMGVPVSKPCGHGERVSKTEQRLSQLLSLPFQRERDGDPLTGLCPS